MSPMNPANPISPLNIANPANPHSPLSPLNPLNPLHPLNPANPSSPTQIAIREQGSCPDGLPLSHSEGVALLVLMAAAAACVVGMPLAMARTLFAGSSERRRTARSAKSTEKRNERRH